MVPHQSTLNRSLFLHWWRNHLHQWCPVRAGTLLGVLWFLKLEHLDACTALVSLGVSWLSLQNNSDTTDEGSLSEFFLIDDSPNCSRRWISTFKDSLGLPGWGLWWILGAEAAVLSGATVPWQMVFMPCVEVHVTLPEGPCSRWDLVLQVCAAGFVPLACSSPPEHRARHPDTSRFYGDFSSRVKSSEPLCWFHWKQLSQWSGTCCRKMREREYKLASLIWAGNCFFIFPFSYWVAWCILFGLGW